MWNLLEEATATREASASRRGFRAAFGSTESMYEPILRGTLPSPDLPAMPDPDPILRDILRGAM